MNNINLRVDADDAIESELDYQRRRWGFRDDDGNFDYAPHSVGEFILIMEQQLSLARAAWGDSSCDDQALEQLRKVTALGYQCFEQHGCPLRKDGPVINNRDGRLA